MDFKRSLPYAGAGILATAAGMAAGHLVAAFVNPASSPVLVVGATVIDLTPTPVKEWAVSTFGNADKPILIGSVMIGTLVLAGVAGVLARRSFAIGAGILLGLVAIAGAMALLRPVAVGSDALPAAGAAVLGVSALWLLTHGVSRPSRESLTAGAVDAEGAGPSRRVLLIGAGAVAAASLAMGSVGELVARARTRIGNVALPRPAAPIAPLPTSLHTRFDEITPLRIPNGEFYRVDVNLTLPIVPVDDWTLEIDGDVDNPFTIDFDELTSGELEVIERDITLTCVSNEVGGRYVGGTRWLGVRLTDLLDRAGVGGKADQILSTAEDGFTISTPLEVATDGRDAMVAFAMDGQPLPAQHGFPVRLVTPGIYGYVGSTKWLRKLTLTTYAAQEAYWTERGWATEAPIKIASRIDTPKPLARIRPGDTVIGGIAWAQQRGVGRIEVRIDGGPWQPARLGPEVSIDYWRQWYLPWNAESGQHMIASRCITRDGQVQTPAEAKPFPDGSSGYQEIVVIVE